MTQRFIPGLILAYCLMAPSWISGQGLPGPLDAISGKFVKYCKSVPREEVFIHTDREKYIAGENLWFKVYLIDRQTSTSSSSSQLVYFEILNPDNQPVVSKRIEIENGSGSGEIVLPDTLSSGNYTVRAYTNWMKNFFPANCFRKDIEIYNALNNRIFKENAGNSSGIISGINKSGTPAGGLSLKILTGDPGNLKFSIIADDSFINTNGILCYLFIQTHGNINYTGSVRISGDTTVVYVPRQNIAPGINQVTVFNSSGRPVFESYLYTPRNDKKDISVNITGNPGLRDRLEIEISGQQGQSLPPQDLSISVSPLSDSAYSADIADYMIFGTEFGILPDKIRKMQKNEIPAEELDMFLASGKSNWIDWDAILAEEVPSFRYQFEKENHYIYGKLEDIGSRLPVADEYIFMSKPGKTAAFQYARTDKNGSFTFELPISGQVQDLVFQPENISNNLKIRLESPFSEEFIQAGKSQVRTLEVVPQHISEWSANYQVREIYDITSSGDPVTTGKPLSPISRFYGKPDIQIRMDDYIKLPVMTEVFFELVPGVSFKEKKSVYEFSIFDLTENRMNTKPPSMFIDGVIIGDAGLIAGLDPEIVEKIDVIKDPYLVGRYIFYGMINVITRKGDFSCVSLPDYAVRLPIRVTDPVSSFISPEYPTREMKQSSIPDFRSTLYWDPSPVPGTDGKLRAVFWTSDYASDFVINIQGITATGEPVSFRKIIKVGKKISY